MSAGTADVGSLVPRLRDEAARRRRELQEERDRHARTRQALAEANRLLVAASLRGRLADPADFEVFVGVGKVEDEVGRVVWSRLEQLVVALLEAKPHLAAPPRGAPSFDSRDEEVG